MADRYNENALQHYGILGQKWGERRYQNPDGTYTEEGLKRKRKDRKMSERTKKALKIAATAAAVAGAAHLIDKKIGKDYGLLGKKQLNSMSKEDLDKVLERLKAQKDILDKQDELHPRIGGYVKKVISKIGDKTIPQVGTSIAVALGINWVKEYLEGVKMPSPKDKW